MKKTFIFLFALALALGLCLVTLTPAAANPGTTYYVSTTGSDETGTGSWYYPWKTIQHAVGQVASGDTINVAPGIYVESPEIIIDKNLSIIGASSATTTIKPSGDTAPNGAMFLINPGITLHISSVTLDGTGKKIWYALKYKGGGSVTDCDFKNIQYDPSGPNYQGIAICAYGEAYDDTIDFDDNVDITGCTFAGIGRVGVLYFGPGITDSTYSDNTYAGKGDGDWLDYALDVGSGPNVTITGSTISDCTGVASSDNSTSSGIMVTDLYKDYCPAYSSTEAAITDNSIFSCTSAIAVGYDDADLSAATISGNTFENNRYQVDCMPDVDVNLEATLAGNTFDRAVVVRGSGINVPAILSRIQDAIDAASAGDTIDVYPGTYDQDEANDRDLYNGGAGTTDLNIFVDKSLTILGVDEDGNPITAANDVQAFVVPERDTPISNLCTIFIQADNVTISGLNVTNNADPDNNFKTISVIGDNVTIKDCKLHAYDQVSCIYMYDPRYDDDTDTSYIQSYAFEDNYLDMGNEYPSGIRISSGPGWSVDVANRIVSGNTFDLGGYGIEFVGPGGDPWDYYPVGAATITGNNFSGQDKGSVVAWGKYKDAVGYGNIDWDGIFNGNTFDKSVIVKTSGGDVRYYDYTSGPPNFYYVRGIYSAIQRYPINRVAQAGDTIHVAAGTYQEQVVINKSLTIEGTGDPVIQAPASVSKFKFPESGAWWDPVLFAFGGTNAGGSISGADTITVSISGFTVDGTDRVPYDRAAGILLRNAGGNVTDNTVQNMYIDGKQTLGILVYGDSDVVIMGNDVSGYSRGGIVANGDSITSPSYPTPHAVIAGNTVTGPGMGVPVTWAPNGIQIGYKATGKIIGNDVSANGWPGGNWTGSGIIVAGADNVEIYGNTAHGGETGIAVCGYMWSPTGATAQGTWIHNNTVSGNTYGISLQDKSLDTTIEHNTITDSDYDGIDICNFKGYAPTGTVIRYNTIADNNALDDATSGGIWIDSDVDGNEVTVNLNNIVNNNQFGIINTGTANDADARYNWWGDPTGPYQANTNPSGTGNAVSDNVDYSPWWGANYIGAAHPWTWYTNDCIQEAINAASAGDTIVVTDGTYYENVVIDKSLTLETASVPVINGDTNADTIPDGSCITLNADGVTIDGFELTNGYNGIIGETSGSTIQNCVIHNNLNYVDSNGMGIALWGDNDNNEILNNEIYDNDRQGIFIGYDDFDDNPNTTPKISTGNTISGNTIYHNGKNTQENGPDDSAYGIQLWNADGNTIEGNEVYNHDDWFPYGGTTFDFAQGIYLCASFDNTLTGNDLHDNNYGVGIWSTGRTLAGSNEINYNKIVNNTGYGVKNYDAAVVDATYNWWGVPTGPYHPSLNPGGTGNAVSDNVLFDPWFIDEELTIPVVHTTYKFDYEVPDLFVAREEAVVPVTFETDVLGNVGYDNVRFKFSATGPGDVIFKAKDSEEHEYTFVNSGFWGPSTGFNLPASYTATTNWTLNFSEPGEYTINFSLIAAPDGEVIAGIEGSQIVDVRAHDILDYYRRLHAPYDKVDTLDLLAAADAWIANTAPPGFDEPITTLQLLQLADEWFAS
jgi:parallel beta-helix repeat protein